MKLTLLLMCMTALQISANVYSQNVKITVPPASGNFEDVINAIEEQSDFKIFYKNEQVDLKRRVLLTSSSGSLTDLLEQALKGTDMSFTVLDKIIVLSPKENSELYQQVIVKGKVVGEDGSGMPGVNVVEKGTTNGTITDPDGNFSITVSSTQSTLVFSFVGYDSKEMVVGNETNIVVEMTPSLTSLEEVVVVGYGVQKKKLVTGATTQVKNEDIVKNHVTRIESALQGITPGMTIVKQSGQPGSEYNISIRGLSSINGNGPLVLIDGVPGNLNTLNPSDVESVDVLKDAASAAIYGSRAANGVVLITTKKGKSGEPQITYEYYRGISNAPKKAPALNAREYAIIMNEASVNSGGQPFFSPSQINSFGNGTDWQEEAYNKDASSQSHYLGITGGNDKSTYSVSLSYSSEEGIFDTENKSKYERTGFRVNSEHKMKKFLTVGENLTYTHRYSRGLGVTNWTSNFMRELLQSNPLISAYDTAVYDGYGRSSFNQDQINPIASMHYNYNEKKKYDDIIGNVYAEAEIIKGLKIRSDFGGTLSFTNNSNQTDTFRLTPSTYNSVPTYRQDMSRTFSLNFDNVISYEGSMGKHNVLALVGMNAQDNRIFKVEGRVDGYLSSKDPVLSNVVPDTTIVKGDFGKGDSRYSYFGRLSYNYDEKYLATVSLRKDGSSRFGKNNRFGYFPSASAGWVISRESFMQGTTSWLEFLKLRASWGQNGKEPADQYVYMARVGNDNRYYSFGSRSSGVSPIISANPDLKWEASTQTNIGFDSRFLNHFSFTFDWYNKTSKDWIMQITVPGVSGIAGISNDNPYINGGNVTNKGVEFELAYNNNIGDLSFEVRANMAYNKNEVTEVPGGFINGASSVLYNGSPTIYRIAENYPIGYFWGYKTNGLFQSTEDVASYKGSNGSILQPGAKPGDVRFVNTNGDDLIDDNDKTQIGDPNPDYIFGLNLTAEYKGFDIAMNIQGQAGNQIVKAYRDEGRFYNNYSTDILDRWTGPGTSNKIPRITMSDEANQNWRRFSDLYIEDADYVKLKSISLGYDFKKSIFKALGIGQFRVFVSATNLLTLTKYSGLDPEVGYGSYYDSAGRLQDAYATGVDLGFYPSARTYLFGVNVKF